MKNDDIEKLKAENFRLKVEITNIQRQIRILNQQLKEMRVIVNVIDRRI